MNIVVDAVFFQLTSTGIARVWTSLLPRLIAEFGVNVFILDRGGVPNIPGAKIIPFPSYTHTATAADSILIQKVCDLVGADVFTSTYYTTPITTPSVMVVYDMIPEVLGFDLDNRIWKEKALAIAHASRLICISDNTRRDLSRLYPHIDEKRMSVAYCGYEPEIFNSMKTESKPKSLGKKPYFLLVGSRVQHKGYKNCKLFFDAVEEMNDSSFDIVCASGELEIGAGFLSKAPQGCKVTRYEFDDEKLAEAYRGALALVYPSLYEGFGMPVLEAMACGCPVITTDQGSLPEVTGGDAALIISGHDVKEMTRALQDVRNEERRKELRQLGLRQAQNFSWGEFKEKLVNALDETVRDAESPRFRAFVADWARLRAIQRDVDVDVHVTP